mgnify:CR=1 FL=1
MALAGTNATTRTTAANFIPEIWSDDIIAAYKSTLVAANKVTKINHVGKKGDTIHLPAPTRGTANAKTATNSVTIQVATDSNIDVVINKHYEYSRLIEDIADIQALNSMRRHYTDDAGYQLAKQTDTDILAQFEGANGGVIGDNDWAGAYHLSAATTIAAYVDATSTAIAVNDFAIRYMMQKLDDKDVPMDQRCIFIPPVARNSVLGIDHYTSADFVSGRPVVNGVIGSIYGMDVLVTTNMGITTTQSDRVITMTHKSAVAFAEQMGVRTQTQYKQEFLADLLTADCIYGVAELRDDASVSLVVPA